MKIGAIIQELERIAPPAYQESYDNAGLLTGNKEWECTGIICSLDATEAVIEEAKAAGCNLIVAHHPIIFGGLKKITGKNYIERTVISAIKNDIAIYAIHTNLDNMMSGVCGKMAEQIGLSNRQILQPKGEILMKLYTFVPPEHVDEVREAVFAAGAGDVGNYSECSFTSSGQGTFKGGQYTNPFIGKRGERHTAYEQKLEIIFPVHLKNKVISALEQAHPYEEVAYDLLTLSNDYQEIGSGLMGDLPLALEGQDFLELLKLAFGLNVVRHTALINKKIRKVALCGGAGIFLLGRAMASGADAFVTADVKYHEFFDADGQILLADIGHWESEQYTIDLLFDILLAKFPTFAVLKTKVRTNPVYYF